MWTIIVICKPAVHKDKLKVAYQVIENIQETSRKHQQMDKEMKTLTFRHDMVESAKNWIGLNTINLHSHTHIKYIKTVIILCLVNVYNHGHSLL